MRKFRVFLGRCAEYNSDVISERIIEALNALSLTPPHGKIVIKPNLVMAHPKVATEGYTRKEMVEAILLTVEKRGQHVEKIDIVEKSGLGVTTATAFRHAGYRRLARRHSARLWPMEERERQRVVLDHGRIHRHIQVPTPLVERDYLVFAPKLKTNVLSHAYSGALKLNIGIVDGKERLFHHHRDLPDKIVDLLEISRPDLIVGDGIRFAFGGNQMTQGAHPLGIVIVADDAVAYDMVCADLLGLDPFGIPHIRRAIERGYGPESPDGVEVVGDVSPAEVRKQTRGLDYGYYPVQRFGSPFRIVTGEPYCTGGCQGILLDWLHMVKDRKPALVNKFPPIPLVVGRVSTPVSGSRVLAVGDCAAASPSIQADRLIRIRGCPPSHKRIVWDMMMKLRLLAPLVRPSLIIDGFVLYPMKKMLGWWRTRRVRSGSRSAVPHETVSLREES